MGARVIPEEGSLELDLQEKASQSLESEGLLGRGPSLSISREKPYRYRRG